MTITARNRLIIALDFPDVQAARALTNSLGDAANFYKIGMELIYAGGLDLAAELIRDRKQVFIDAKLLDIEHTVERAAASIARLGATFLTVHGTDTKTLEAAVRGRGTSAMKLFAVTVMTNLDQNDLGEQGINMPPDLLVARRAKLALDAGFDGVISSGHEAANIRQFAGSEFKIVTPGIRPAGASIGDQTRVMTPAKAIKAGADYLVIGRPITKAANPKEAALSITDEIAKAL